MLVAQHLPTLHDHFEENQVRMEMYAGDWMFAIFTSVLPENNSQVTSQYFNMFFKYKWEFFYKLILSILEHLTPKLLEAEDFFSIMQTIKIAMSNKNDPYLYAIVHRQEQL